jgi:hypothetical protein
MISQSENSDPVSDAVRAPSLAADDIAVYVYSSRLMSMALKTISRKIGDTIANSTSAWLR